MRIVGGKYRGKKLLGPKDGAIRPTSDRAREALFNILAHGKYTDGRVLPGSAAVLDVFAGTGALGLEAWSRGASAVTFLEMDRTALALIEANIAALKGRQGQGGRGLRVSARDATRPGPPPAGPQYDLVLMDPPYSSGLGMVALAALNDQGWLAPDPLAVIEVERGENIEVPAGFEMRGERTYGKSRLLFLRPLGPAQNLPEDEITGSGSGGG